MDWRIFWTIICASSGIVGLIYLIIRNFKTDFNAKFDLLDNRIFQLAMGRSLKEILKEEKEINKEK